MGDELGWFGIELVCGGVEDVIGIVFVLFGLGMGFRCEYYSFCLGWDWLFCVAHKGLVYSLNPLYEGFRCRCTPSL